MDKSDSEIVTNKRKISKAESDTFDFLITNEIKEDIPENEECLVKININYPEYPKIKGNEKTEKIFNEYQKKRAAAFYGFASKVLMKSAEKNKRMYPESFNKYGAVMRYIKSYCDDNILSIVSDISVYTGESEKPITKRTSDIWDRKSGNLLTYGDFFSLKQKKSILYLLSAEARIKQSLNAGTVFSDYERIIKNKFSPVRFYLTPRGYAFWYPSGVLSSEKNPTVLFLLDFKGEGKYNPF